MAKKSKKSRRDRKTRPERATFERPVKQAKPEAEARTQEIAQAAGRATRRGEQVDFRQEYHYVLKDLRLLGAIAAIMLVLLLVLSAFIT